MRKPLTGEPTHAVGDPAYVLTTMCFLKGHRLMVQIQSTWFPVIDRNPQTFVPSIYEAKATDYVPATQRIYCTPARPSHLVLPVVP